MKVSLAYVFIAAASSITVVNSESNPRHRFLKKESKVSKSKTSKSKSSKSKSSKSGSVDVRCVGKVEFAICGDVPFNPSNLCEFGQCIGGSCTLSSRGSIGVPDGVGGFCRGVCNPATGDYDYGGTQECGVSNDNPCVPGEKAGLCNPTSGACEPATPFSDGSVPESGCTCCEGGECCAFNCIIFAGESSCGA